MSGTPTLTDGFLRFVDSDGEDGNGVTENDRTGYAYLTRGVVADSLVGGYRQHHFVDNDRDWAALTRSYAVDELRDWYMDASETDPIERSDLADTLAALALHAIDWRAVVHHHIQKLIEEFVPDWSTLTSDEQFENLCERLNDDGAFGSYEGEDA